MWIWFVQSLTFHSYQDFCFIYQSLIEIREFQFEMVGFETEASQLVTEKGRNLTIASGETQSTNFFKLRISKTIHRANRSSILATIFWNLDSNKYNNQVYCRHEDPYINFTAYINTLERNTQS